MITKEQALEEGRNRLNPGVTNPHWLVLRKRRRIFTEWISGLPAQPLMVLDLGGRIQPYRPLLEGRIRRYVAVDLRVTPLVDVLARGEHLPFAAAQFDLVICTQVLQYVPDPKVVIDEIARVLRPGGSIFLSVPSSYPIDSDGECWRFLPASLRHLLAGFSSVEIVPEGKTVTGLFRTINAYFSILAHNRALRALASYSAYPLANLLGATLERILGSSNQQFAVNYSVLARK